MRYAGKCTPCGVGLLAGVHAFYDREAKSVTCVDCASATSPGAVERREGLPETLDGDELNAPSAIAASAGTEVGELFVGVPGASARNENERRKNKRVARIREAHPIIGGLILALSDDPQSTQAWATGAQGEEVLGARFNGLVDEGVRVLHDRRIPPTKANIDHIAIGPTGVFVIDAKKYAGRRPSLRVEGGILRPRTQTLVVGTRLSTNLVDGVKKQVDHVTTALADAGLGDIPVHGMLCFIEADWPLLGGDFTIDGVQVLWPRKAAEQLVQPGPLDDATALIAQRVLAVAFPSA